MRLRFLVLVCCLVSACYALEETKSKKLSSGDNRGKRNLEYTIYHNYSPSNSRRSERRISTGLQQRFSSPLFPGPRPYSPHRKGRPHSLPPPPYAVQMEPLIHYSQRDPLYDTNTLSLIADNNNDPSKPEDLLTENNAISENVYGAPKHYIDRPIYIREPEPIIEIIIKESNVTLPPHPTPLPTSAPKKKEQVQVFYVKYKKNPNGHGKDSIIYDPPIPAISPLIEDEHEEEQPPISYGVPEHITAAPPPSTTLRTIIKPDSETYHSPSGIKVTFGKESFDYDKRSSKSDDDKKEGSAPEPAVTHPEARQFPLSQPVLQRRQPVLANYQPAPTFRPDIIRFPSPAFRTFTSSQYRHPGSSLSKPYSPPLKSTQQSRLVPHFQAPLTRPSSPQFSQPLPNFQNEFTFNGPRQPVPYQPFTYLKPQQPAPSTSSAPSSLPSLQPQLHSQFDFPTHTHFPIQQQQLPIPQQQHVFNQLPQRYESFPPQSNSGTEQYTIPKQPQRYQQPQSENAQQVKEPTPQPQLQYTQQPPAQVLQQQFNKQQQEQLQQQYYQQQLQKQEQAQKQQQQLQQQYYQQFQQKQKQAEQQQQRQQQQQQQQQQQPQQQQRLVPPGGELIQSLSKYEQHISVNADGSQQEQKQQEQLTPEQYKQQILQQYIQNPSGNHYTQNAPTQQNSNFLKSSVSTYYTTARPSPTKQIYVSSSTTTERPTTPRPTESTTVDTKSLNVQLPDEVPDELRQQLLSSGILKNADISVLDYDKVGDIPLSALPPDQLANFFNAGGAQQIAGSEPVPAYVDKDGTQIKDEKELEAEASETSEVTVPAPVEMKVVHYNPETEQGQKVQEFYVKDTATQLDPVVLDDQTYNKYLPLKVNGAEFPIPDVPELKGKNITSVVVLAPVTYSAKGQRRTREVETVPSDIEFITSNLKELVENPTRENYEKFLQKENTTASEKQSVILLVAEAPTKGNATEKEIYMYDIATKTVNKLSGELSAAFVEAAEANAEEEKTPGEVASGSNTVESRVTYAEDRLDEGISESDLSDSASDFVESKVPIVDSPQGDLETDASELVESFLDVAVRPQSERISNSEVSISSGYSKLERNTQ